MVRSKTTASVKEEMLDVSSLINAPEDKRIVPVEEASKVTSPAFAEATTGKQESEVKPSTFTSQPDNAPTRQLVTPPDEGMFERRIQDDLRNAFEVKGFLDIVNTTYGFLRPSFAPSSDDIYVSMSQIRKFQLRQGDQVVGLARPPKQNEKYHGLLKITRINDLPLQGDTIKRRKYEELTPIYPNRQITLEYDTKVISTRIIDLLAPIGYGQRGMIVSPPKAGKTTFLKEIAMGVVSNNPNSHLIAILIGERPEEVTDMKRNIKGEVVASNFDESPEHQIAVAELGLARAKRLVEIGKDVVILLDSITRLARAYNLSVGPSGKTLSGGFDPAALFPAKKFLGAARNCEEGGSLTIIGTALVETGSRMDDLIYEEFKGTGNMEVHLERKLAEKRVYPAINIERSGTRHDELLQNDELFKKITTLRHMLMLLDEEQRAVSLIDKLGKSKTNKEFLEKLNTAK